MSQTKVSIPEDEWERVVAYFNKHKKNLIEIGVRSPTALLRYWIRLAMKTPYRKNE